MHFNIERVSGHAKEKILFLHTPMCLVPLLIQVFTSVFNFLTLRIFCDLTVGDNILVLIRFRKVLSFFCLGKKSGLKRGEGKSSRSDYQNSPKTQIKTHILFHLWVNFVLNSSTYIMYNLWFADNDMLANNSRLIWCLPAQLLECVLKKKLCKFKTRKPKYEQFMALFFSSSHQLCLLLSQARLLVLCRIYHTETRWILVCISTVRIFGKRLKLQMVETSKVMLDVEDIQCRVLLWFI